MQNHSNRVRAVVSVLLASSVVSSAALADDVTVTSGLQQASALFNQRSATNSQSIDDALSVLGKLEGQADDSNLNYDVLILESRALYWKGEHASTSADKVAIFLQGQAKANDAKDINDGYADAYYFSGINLARWAEAKGILESISRKQELIDLMNSTMERNTRDGQSGENIDGDGPNRVFGRMYFKLPGILGGSHDKSVQFLKKAVEDGDLLGNKVPLNIVYYAETLSTGNSSEKAQARQLLDNLLKNDPKTYNPSRVPENLDEFAEARQLRSQI